MTPASSQAYGVLISDGQGRWTVDGEPAPQLDGLIDVDPEASACTNTLPVHRLPLPPTNSAAPRWREAEWPSSS